MKVFFGKNKKTGENVVIKLEKEQKKKSSAINEAIILTKLKGIEQIPSFFDYNAKKD